jgi:hypothetical protein
MFRIAMDLNVNENDCQSALPGLFSRADERFSSWCDDGQFAIEIFASKGETVEDRQKTQCMMAGLFETVLCHRAVA